MKRRIVLAGAAVLALLLIACCFFLYSLRSRPPKPTEYKPPKSLDYKHAVITLKRTACYGFCPVYTLTIYGDGRIVYEGEACVGVTGRQTAQISPDDVKALVDEFYRIDYFSLKDEYRAPETDLPTTITSITVDGRSKEVLDYVAGPVELKELEDRIDEVAGSEKWVAWTGRNRQTE